MLEDSKIMDLFDARDERAIAALSEKYGSTCGRISENILKNQSDAEECVNDAYLAVWNAIPPAKPNPLSTFLFRIVRNISIAKYHANTSAKRNSRYDVALEELEECLGGFSDVEQEAQANELSACLDRFLDILDRESRLMFMCRYWCSDSVSDIAKVFGTSAHTVSVRLFRIREKLKKYLIKEGYEV